MGRFANAEEESAGLLLDSSTRSSLELPRGGLSSIEQAEELDQYHPNEDNLKHDLLEKGHRKEEDDEHTFDSEKLSPDITETTEERPPTPLPKMKIVVLACILISESFAITMIFPFVPFMVADFHLTEDTKEVPFYVGWIASSFFLAQFASSFFWGWLSDNIGRRPVLLLGLIGNMISALAFGFSHSLTWAIVSRTMHGLLNGNIGVCKCYLGEVTDESNQAKGFSLLGLTMGFSTIVGPAIGGLLSRPAQKYPLLFPEDSFLDHHPYVLPCFVSACVTLVGLVIGFFFLTETLPSKQPGFQRLPEEGQEIKTFSVTTLSSDDENGEVLSENDEEKAIAGNNKNNIYEDEEMMQAMDKKSKRDLAASVSSPGKKGMKMEAGIYSALRRYWQRIKKSKMTRLLRNRAVVASSFLYAILGLVHVAYDELISLWAIESIETGGLDFNSSKVGLAITIGGIGLIVFNLFIYPYVDKRIGARRAFMIGCALTCPLFISYPCINLIARAGLGIVVIWIAVLLVICARSISTALAFTSIMLLINNSATRKDLGAVNGLAQTGVALSRAISPATTGMLFSWSLKNGLAFPFNFFLVWILLAMGSGGLSIGSRLLPYSINHRASDKDAEGSSSHQPLSAVH
ncbi:MFS domain-containing protein [Balamuthia mandrillaris]